MPSMESNYVLNIAKRDEKPGWDGQPRYVHFCRVELGSGPLKSVQETAAEIAAKFPAPDYSCDLMYWSCAGHTVKIPGQ